MTPERLEGLSPSLLDTGQQPSINAGAMPAADPLELVTVGSLAECRQPIGPRSDQRPCGLPTRRRLEGCPLCSQHLFAVLPGAHGQ